MANSSTAASLESANPLVLEWAREQAAYKLDEVERLLQVSPGTVRAWERGLAYPDIKVLRELSRLYDVPFSYFFLEVPPEEPQIRDYRGVPEDRRKKLSRETQLALREFRRLSGLARALQEVTGKVVPPEIGRAYPHENPEDVARREGERLGITQDLRKRLVTKEDAYQTWRRLMEGLGIFVFSLSMPSSECRGAAISEESYATAILVKQNDPPTARSFTLFHEYCHLLLATDSQFVMCDHFPGDTESFSNRFASSILLPHDEFVKVLNDKGLYQYRDWWIDATLSELAGAFFVSKDVIAIRLENLELAPSGFYRNKRERWDRLFQKKGGFGPGGKGKKTYAQEKLGPSLLGLTLEAVQTGALHPVHAALCIGEVRTGKRPWRIKVRDIESWTKKQEGR